jgi:amino acid transporter
MPMPTESVGAAGRASSTGGAWPAARSIRYALSSASPTAIANAIRKASAQAINVARGTLRAYHPLAGWDRLIPPWFSRLSPRYRTPVNSVLFIGGCALVFAALGMIGVGEQEAFQLLAAAAGILYGLTYLVLFAIPLVGLARTGRRAPLWIRIAAAIGFATATLYVVLSIFPIVDVVSRLAFALKIGGLVVIANVLGAALYRWNRRRARSSATPGTGSSPPAGSSLPTATSLRRRR